MNKQRGVAAGIAGMAIAVAIGIRVATEEPDWQAIEDYRAVKEGANIIYALAEARKIVELGSHERFVDAAEFLIERGAVAYEVDNLDIVLSGIDALETLPVYGDWPSMFGYMDKMQVPAPEIDAFLTKMMRAADEGRVVRSTARYYLAARLARSINTVPDGERDDFRERALQLATGLSAGIEDEEFVGDIADLNGESSKRTLEAAEEELIATIRHTSLGSTAKGGCANFDGVEERLADYRGQVLLVNFWATWCGPCIAGVPKLREFVEQMPPAEFELVNVSMDFNLAFAQRYRDDELMPGTHWYSGMDGELTRMWQVRAIPVYVLIDEQGRILARVDALTDEFLAQVRDAVANVGA